MDIPDSYDDSRARFLSYADQIRNLWPAASFEAHPLTTDPSVSIDWCTADAIKRKERFFILTTALHGIEGYVGSAMLDIFVNDYLPRFDPSTSGILLVHAINPWGMKNWQRTNPNNVDLNRNFCNPGELKDVNPDYDPLYDFLNPIGELKSITFSSLQLGGQIIDKLVNFGVARVREAALMGQYRQPKGIYFGGTEIQEETQVLMGLFEKHIAGYAHVTHLDMHTGYGPRDQMTLVNSAEEPLSSVETADRFQVPRVAGLNPEEFYTIHGDMTDYLYKLVLRNFPNTKIYSGAFEFGTYGDTLLDGIRELRTTIFQNRANQFGAYPTAQNWVDVQYRELYLPSDPTWRIKAEADGQQTFDGILKAEGFCS